MTSNKYDPLTCLKEEVARFKATNQFAPMLVTGFYMQAGCVIAELEAARRDLEVLRKARDRQAAVIRRLEATINEYEDQAVEEGRT